MRPALAAPSVFTSTCSTFPIGSWRNRVPTRRNSSGSPVARKPYPPRRPSSFSRPGLAQPRLDLVGDRLARADDRDAAAELPLQHRADERVVGAAEDDRVDARALERPAGALDAGEHAVVDVAAGLDQRGELGGGDGVQLGVGAVSASARA